MAASVDNTKIHKIAMARATTSTSSDFDGIVKGVSTKDTGNDYEDEYGDPIGAHEEEFIVLLEENGKAVFPSPCHGQRRSQGKVLAILSKAAVVAREQQLQWKERTSRRQQCICLVFMGLLVALLPLMLFGGSLQGQTTKSKVTTKNNDESSLEMKVAFQISQRRFQMRLQQAVQQNYNTTQEFRISPTGYANLQESPFRPSNPTHKGSVINSIRVPKASSSALSVKARALAGCHPDGYPCCRMPGSPVGTCPRDDLMCLPVTGCGGHRPVFNGTEPIISKIREPAARLLSGFFYFPPHRPPVQQGHGWNLFEQSYIKSAKYRNVMTKMFSGYYAYDKFDPKIHTVEQAKKNLCRTAWFGQVEYPVLSSLLLYEASAFQWLVPNPVAFGLPATDGGARREKPPENTPSVAANSSGSEEDGLRVNSDEEYAAFKHTIFPNHNGTDLVQRYNQEDFELFEFMHQLFCARVHGVPGLVEDARQANIATNELESCREVLLQASMSQGAAKETSQAVTTSDLCPTSSK
jgi:hypothetical protein